uniref:Myb/SANT-like DNA-binding domain-containing protein n=1 Tax=Anguilla anguilla TaxID=7936 RepID=A0A0E9XUR7_ANGAN
MDQKRKANFLEDEITAMVEEIEDRQHVLFSGLNSGLTNKAKQVAWECVAAAVNEVGQQDITVADLKKKWSDLKLQGEKNSHSFIEQQHINSLTCPSTVPVHPLGWVYQRSAAARTGERRRHLPLLTTSATPKKLR